MPRAYEILHVGERSPKDKKYETSEVVLAPEGTVVAPIPKGMKVNMANARNLIGKQVLSEMQKKPRKMALGGISGPANAPGTNPGLRSSYPTAPRASLTPIGSPTGSAVGSTSAASSGASTGSGMYATPNYAIGGGGTASTSYDPMGLLNTALGFSNTASDYALGQQRLGIERGQLGLGQDSLALNERIASDQNALGYAQIEAEMDRLLKNIAAQKYIAQLQHALGLKGLDLGERERLDAWNLGNRNLDIQAMDDEFDRIMRGVSEASVAGVRSGRTPSFGLF